MVRSVLALFLGLALSLSTLVLAAPQAWAFGAVAVDDEEGSHPDDIGYGYSIGAASRGQAERDAMTECRRAGNRNCRIVVWFESCGAYAASHRYFGVGWGGSIDTAERNALEQCGLSSCRVVISQCE
jgi:hypothetical protein